MNSTDTHLQKDPSRFATRLLDWYGVHARSMPWRIPPQDHAQGVRQDAYRTWLSEVMLQQTQVATVRDYYLKFTQKWPRVEDLAASDQEDVLKAWAGLGYYSRARNLKKCADEVVATHNSKFPDTYDQLKTLPGIGDYTASAIASIAFDEPVPVMDGNVERVIARHKTIKTPFPKAKPEIKAVLVEVLDTEKPGEFAQAMMDLGATICTPKKPACSLCPINEDCQAHINGTWETYPVKLPKKLKPTRKGAAFIIENTRGEIFLCKRPETGLLAGMTQVPTTNWTVSQDGKTGTTAAPMYAEWQKRGIARHTFTHFHLELEVWHTTASEMPFEGWWCRETQLKEEALPKVMHKVLALR